MKGPIFDSIEKAVDYLNLERFPLSHEVQIFEGKKVIVLLMLSEAESQRYAQIKLLGSRAASKATWTTGLKAIAQPAVDAVGAAHSPKPIKAATSFWKLQSVLAGSELRAARRAKISEDENGRIYMMMDKAFNDRRNESYYEIKTVIYKQLSGYVHCLEGNIEGKHLFMIRLT